MRGLALIVFLVAYGRSVIEGSVSQKIAQENAIAGFRFGEMQIFAKAELQVFHMEEDKFEEGYILYSDGHSLKTTDGKQSWSVVGKANSLGYVEGTGSFARFKNLISFHQLNSSHLLAVDGDNHCIRMVNRNTNHTYPFVGTCTKYGFIDGPVARFWRPWSIVSHQPNPNLLIVSDYNNNALRLIDIKRKYVSTLLKQGLHYPTSICHGFQDQVYYIGNLHYISEYSFNGTAVRLSGTTARGTAGSWISNARFSFPNDIMNLDDEVLLVADKDSHRIKVVDVEESWVRHICTGTAGTKDGTIKECEMYRPWGLLMADGYLYVGQYKSIRRLQVSRKSARSVSTKCPDDMVVEANSLTNTASVTLNFGAATHNINLQLGVHHYSVTSGDTKCSFDIDVYDGALKRRLGFQAQYNVDCKNVLTPDNTKLLQSVAKERYRDIEKICGDCKTPTDPDINISCTNGSNSMTVFWPTKAVYPASVTDVPEKLVQEVSENLDKHPKSLEMIIANNILPVIYPSREFEDFLSLESFCLHGKIYDEENDLCMSTSP